MVFETETGFRTPTTVGQIILLITFLINSWLSVRRENRQRQWMLEDAIAKQKQLEDHEKKMKAQLDVQTKEIKSNLEKRTQEISSRFDSLLEDRNDR
jgi:uncharacterized membrane protein YhiD involved in acid resistance